MTKLEAIVGNPDWLRDVARDIITHFDARQEVFAAKPLDCMHESSHCRGGDV